MTSNQRKSTLKREILDVLYNYIVLVSKTIIFDLDETLIHCNDYLKLPHDVKLTIKFPQGIII